ncbi:hypothetical protein [Microbacterium sp. LWH10-1.2]|uniref:type IV toxin-antitoxin system AbiEi family antitoxin domain-containing protein n=1 Tax=Microbacterium sp. LWH10-1.2 TaxID=3135255 RepID=UPI003139DB74
MKPITLARVVERAPMRTVRWKDVAQTSTNAPRDLARLEDEGVVLKIAQGVYTAPPDGADGRRWKPPLEAAGLALATARFGQRRVALMGLGAARFWGAIPRAIGTTTIAVPVAGRPPVTLTTGGTVHLIPRDLDALDLVLERTPLGEALITTPAQTLYDVLARPMQGGAPDVAREAAANLRVRVDADELRGIAGRARRVPLAVQKTIADMEAS